MTQNTETLLKAIFAIDQTITADQAKSALEALKSNITINDNTDRVISRSEVAKLMGKSVKAVDIYGRRGVIRRVYITGGGNQRVQAQGYSRNSVLEVINNGKRRTDR